MNRSRIAASRLILLAILCALTGIITLAITLHVPLTALFRDNNPAMVRLDVRCGTLDVCNRSESLLWSRYSADISSIMNASEPSAVLEGRLRQAQVADLDGDGHAEVLTSLRLGGDSLLRRYPLTILTSRGRMLRQLFYYDSVQFRGRGYPAEFSPKTVIASDILRPGDPEIYTICGTDGPPVMICRHVSNGTTRAKYFHFGEGNIALLRFAGKPVMFFYGRDDTGLPETPGCAILAVLDPEQLLGRRESSATAGFGFRPSGAERFYLRFPLTEMNLALRAGENVTRVDTIRYDGSPAVRIRLEGGYRSSDSPAGLPCFDLVLSDRMEVRSVSVDPATARLRTELIRQKRISPLPDQEWRSVLMRGVQYWDGNAWKSGPVNVTAVEH